MPPTAAAAATATIRATSHRFTQQAPRDAALSIEARCRRAADRPEATTPGAARLQVRLGLCIEHAAEQLSERRGQTPCEALNRLDRTGWGGDRLRLVHVVEGGVDGQFATSAVPRIDREIEPQLPRN